MDETEYIHITLKEYLLLKEQARFLSALEAAGVDNWSGYSQAYEILAEWDDEDNE